MCRSRPGCFTCAPKAALSQEELAARSGVAQSNLAAYEAGTRRPSAAMLARLRTAAPPRPSVALRRHREAIIALAGRHKARDVRVFGTTVRESDISGSDLDLLVRMDPDADAFDLAELIEELRGVTGVVVDVVSEAGLRAGTGSIRDEARPL